MDVNFYIELMAWNLGSREQWFSILQNCVFLLLKRYLCQLFLWSLEVHKPLIHFLLPQGHITFGNRGSNVGAINTSVYLFLLSKTVPSFTMISIIALKDGFFSGCLFFFCPLNLLLGCGIQYCHKKKLDRFFYFVLEIKLYIGNCIREVLIKNKHLLLICYSLFILCVLFPEDLM